MRSTTAVMPRLLTALVVALLAVGVAGFTPSVARAICNPLTCEGPTDPTSPTPPPPPPPIAISSLTPSFGWAGDRVVIGGTSLTGASVTFNGVPTPVLSGSSTQLTVDVPVITNLGFGQTQVPVTVSSSKGTSSATFTLSPTLQASAGTTFGLNAEFGQGMDGSAQGSISLDRQSGFAVSKLNVTDTQWWWSLSVAMSVALVDKSGTVIGFTTPNTVTASGVAFAWPSGVSTASGTFTEALPPSMTAQVKSARVLLVRDGAAELWSTLQNAVALGQSLAAVLSALGIV